MSNTVKIVKKVVWKDPSCDGIFITHVAEGEEKVVEEQYKGFPHAICDADKPIIDDDEDKMFVNAYEIKNKKVTLNMDKCKDIHMHYCRNARNARLDELDKDHFVALGKGDKKALKVIETKKQSLRDVPKLIDKSLKGCKTLKDIKRVLPPIIRSV